MSKFEDKHQKSLDQKGISGERVFAYVLLGAPILFYFYCIFVFGVNVPFWDDYDSLRQHINISTSDSFKERISILFSQHNEHRIVFNRIIFILYDGLFDEINFKFLPILGNSALLVIFCFFWKSLPNSQNKHFLIIPVAWMLFQLQNWRNMTWTLASLSNLFVLCFAAISFYFLCKEGNKNYLIGFLFASASVFSQGSGMGVLPVFLCYLLVVKKFKESLIWSLGILILSLIYFIGYEKPAIHPSILDALKNQAQLWSYFFLFLGGILFFSKKLAIFCGFIFFILFIYLTNKKYYLEKPSLYLFIAFLILTGAMAALTRSGFGVEQAFAYRYKIISILLTISFYIVVLGWGCASDRWTRPFLVSLISFSIIFYILSFEIGLINLKDHRIQMVQGLNNWLKNKKGLAYPRPKMANEILSLAIKKNIYHISAFDK